MKLLVLGVDAADPQVIERLGADLPNLIRLKKSGASGTIRSLTSSFDIWTTYYTGVLPERHGVMETSLRKVQSREDRRNLLSRTRVTHDRFLWDFVTEAEMRFGMVEGLVTWPAPEIDGFWWADWLIEGDDDTRFFPPSISSVVYHPERLGLSPRVTVPEAVTLRDLGVEQPFESLSEATLWSFLSSGDGYHAKAVNAFISNLDYQYDVVTYLCDQHPVDVLFWYTPYLDWIQHYTFYEQDLRLVKRAYQAVDQFVGRMVAKLQPETTLCVSDHGMAPLSDVHEEAARCVTLRNGRLVGPAYSGGILSADHAPEGFYAMSGPLIKAGAVEDISYTDILPLMLASMGLSVPQGLDGTVPGVVDPSVQPRETPKTTAAQSPLLLHELLPNLRPGAQILLVDSDYGIPWDQVPANITILSEASVPLDRETSPNVHWMTAPESQWNHHTFRKGQFDLVVALWKLERLTRPERFIALVDRWTRRNGELLITFPDSNSLEIKLLRSFLSRDRGGHQTSFTIDKLLRLVYSHSSFKLDSFADWPASFGFLRGYEHMHDFRQGLLEVLATFERHGIDMLSRERGYVLARFVRGHGHGMRIVSDVCWQCGSGANPGDSEPDLWTCQRCGGLNRRIVRNAGRRDIRDV